MNGMPCSFLNELEMLTKYRNLLIRHGSSVRHVAAGLMFLGFAGTAGAQSAEVVEYYHLDALGSVRAVTNQSGAVVRTHDYRPFGEGENPAAGSEPTRFTGKERDAESGLDYFGARYYASRSGRFTTVDPGHVGGTIFNPQSWNGYAYALNNPLRFVDPLGMEACQITLRGADAEAAGVADGGTVTGECVHGNKESWSDWFDRNIWGFVPFSTTVQAPGLGEADLPLVDRSPDTAVFLAATVIAPRVAAGRIAGRLTQEGLEHIVLRHWATSGAKGAGKFLAGTTARSLKAMINQALEQGAVRANTAGRVGQIVELDFGKQIGVSMSGGAATRLRVVLSPDGTVITAFPF
jgi:RHS repeat-associated protein